ncbi:zinc knuckle [Ostertagia ostertagi]
MFMALPRAVKEQGFERVVAEMAKLLALDSTAGRLRALTELRKLRIRPNQDVSEFCVVLGKAGATSKPRSDNRGPVARICPNSLGQSQRLARAFPASGSAHRVEPHRAYDEVKQLALSIEQSKLMLKANRRPPNSNWKNRFAQYRGAQESKSVDYGRGAARQEYGRMETRRGEDSERHDSFRKMTQLSNAGARQGSEVKKCYNCSRYGHIGRDCPQRVTRVNQIEKKEQKEKGKEAAVSSIIHQARSLGMAVKGKERIESALIGNKLVASVRLLDGKNPALIDTGINDQHRTGGGVRQGIRIEDSTWIP